MDTAQLQSIPEDSHAPSHSLGAKPTAHDQQRLGKELWNFSNAKDRAAAIAAVRKQVAGYARDLLCYGIPQSHALILLVDDCFVGFALYDHSLIIESEVSTRFPKDGPICHVLFRFNQRDRFVSFLLLPPSRPFTYIISTDH